jgi:hypothetical protein
MPPKTHAERQKAYRLSHGEKYLEKETTRMKFKRSLLTEEEKENIRVKDRKRKQVKRLLSENPVCDNIENTFSTPQSLGRAMNKVTRVLPLHEEKRKTVIRNLCDQHGIDLKPSTSDISSTTSDQILHDHVKTFYERDDISRMAPGLRDVSCDKKTKEKVSINLIFLLAFYPYWWLPFCFFIYRDKLGTCFIQLGKHMRCIKVNFQSTRLGNQHFTTCVLFI